MNAKIYLDTKPDKESNCQLFFVITGSGQRSKIFSGIKINPKNWDGQTINRRESNADLKNSILQAKFSALNRIIAEASIRMMNTTPEEIKKAFIEKSSSQSAQDNKTLGGKTLFVKFLKEHENTYKNIHKQSTIRSIKQVKDRIESFDPEINIEDINHNWLVRYCTHLVDLEMQDSTIKYRHLKLIKSACKEATRNGIVVSDHVGKFRWSAQPKQPFFATWEEVEKIYQIPDFTFPIMEKIRDLFIISCYTGLRDSDMRLIKPEAIFSQGKQKMLKIKMVKTGFEYSIPLAEQVLKILAKYNYSPPSVSQQKYNELIKIVAQMVVTGESTVVKTSGNKRKTKTVKRCDMFTTHTGRRTFGRRFLDKGGSLIVLSKIFGHSDTSTTLRYIGYQPQEVVSEFLKVFG